MGVGVCFVGDLGKILAIEFEKNISSVEIFHIFISEFDHKYKPCQVILFVVDKDCIVLLDRAILFLSLGLSQRIKCRRESLLDA